MGAQCSVIRQFEEKNSPRKRQITKRYLLNIFNRTRMGYHNSRNPFYCVCTLWMIACGRGLHTKSIKAHARMVDVHSTRYFPHIVATTVV